MNYSDKLKDPRWQKKRLEILNRDNFMCSMCGDNKSTLIVHYKYYTKDMEPWEYPDELLITLCELCHTFEENQKSIIYDFPRKLLSLGYTNTSMVSLLHAIISLKNPTDAILYFNFGLFNKNK